MVRLTVRPLCLLLFPFLRIWCHHLLQDLSRHHLLDLLDSLLYRLHPQEQTI
jgi:hypothetical protein